MTRSEEQLRKVIADLPYSELVRIGIEISLEETIRSAEARGKSIAVETLEHDRCCPGGWKHLKRLLK